MNAIIPFAASFTVTDVEKIAGAIARGGLFGSSDPYAVLTLCLLAQAEGQHPAVVFRDYHIIKGKPAKKAEAMLRDFIQAGGKVVWHELTDTVASATFSHPQGGEMKITWDHDRAKKAQIVNAMYQKFPRQMLRSRVVSEGIRTIYPGATSGLYEENEVAAFDAPATTTEQPTNETPMIEIQTGETERVKVPGISNIKKRLNAFMLNGNKPDVTLEGFRAMVKASRDDIKAIRDAEHPYWTGDGSEEGEGFEGFQKWMDRRYAELTPPEDSDQLRILLGEIEQCDTNNALQAIINVRGDEIDALDDLERDRFEKAFERRESAVRQMAELTA